MTVRRSALRWLAATHGLRDADVFTSRYYQAEQSWTGRPAWWLQVPVHRIEALGAAGVVHLVCQVPSDHVPAAAAGPFHYLAVPAAFLRAHLDTLDRPGAGAAVSLFLSAEPGSLFRDERGPGRVAFAPFLRRAAADPQTPL